VEELFANGFHAALGTFDIGNPDLHAEQSMGFDAGIDVQQGRTSAHVGAYINRVSDYIRPVAVAGTIEEEGPVVTFEQSAATLTGAELQVETRLAKGLIGGLVSDYLRARQEDGTPLPYIPAARVGASLRFDNGHFSVGGDVRHALNQTDVSGDALDVPTDGYTLVNMSAGWIFTARSRSVHSLTFRIDNVLDTEYHDAASRIKSFAGNPGRNISLVYRLLFQ
jgi:iron complex outermembrane receptor protein